jgi:putative holliday junction resolvase
MWQGMPETPSVAAQTLLAFDFGPARIGVALGNTLTVSARPLATIAETENAKRFAAIASLIAEWGPHVLIVGRPVNVNGEVSEMTGRTERFARQLQGRFGLPVKFADERYTSAVAEDALKLGRADKGKIDAAAAALILQSWLDENKTP